MVNVRMISYRCLPTGSLFGGHLAYPTRVRVTDHRRFHRQDDCRAATPRSFNGAEALIKPTVDGPMFGRQGLSSRRRAGAGAVPLRR
jgi:hypothetical protein